MCIVHETEISTAGDEVSDGETAPVETCSEKDDVDGTEVFDGFD